MASTRRTLSQSTRPWPPIQNHSPPLRSSCSSSSSSSSSSSFSPLSSSLMSFGRLVFRPPRRSSAPAWKSLAVRYFFFLLLGFLLGFFPFADLAVDVVAPHDFTFEIQSPVLEDSGRDQDLVVVKQGHRVMETVEAGSAKHVMLESSREAVGVEEEGVGVGGRKLLIVVTPTYNRALQAYYLARLGHTLRLVPPPLLWVVVEMSAASTETADVLRRTGVMYRHLVCKKNSSEVKDRGVHQRNVALEHIERHRMDGIVYFADDDNIYSLELFDQMREVRRFGTWPVAMLAKSKSKAIMEGPVCNESQIIGWHTNEKSKRLRRFHVDMSGFAFNSTILWDPKRWHHPTSNIVRQLDTVKEGFQETTFIQQVVEDEFQMEAIPSGCSKILVWHLHLDFSGLFYPRGWRLLKNLETVIPI